jgi:hypothetical protein
MKLYIFGLICLLALSSCAKRNSNNTAPSDVDAMAPIRADLLQNGVIENGWSISCNDRGMDDWPAIVFSDANTYVKGKVRSVFSENDYFHLKIYLMPDLSGYTVVVLSRCRLNDREQQEIKKAADSAMDEAYKRWLDKAKLKGSRQP